MPTSPGLAARILELINDPKASAADFGAAIRTDPALSTRLLKTANSAQFAQRNTVTQIDRAVTVLGLKRVKTISLGFQLVSHLDRLGGVPFDLKTFWQHSLLRACIARSIAHDVVPEREEEAFLVGLLQECGVLLLVQVLECNYANLYSSDLSPTAFFAVETKSFAYTHVDAIAVMAAEWKLPDAIAEPLIRHHRRMRAKPTYRDVDRLNAISYFVGGLCFAAGVKIDAHEHELQSFRNVALDISDDAWKNVQRRALDDFGNVSTLYGNVLPEDVDVTELLSEANHQLAAVASDADQRVLNVEAEQEAVKTERRRLEGALRDYRERASLDPLTNVMNRGALTDAARKAIEENLDTGKTVAVLFLDIDNFKRLNDTYGHKLGDNVLKTLAAILVREVGGAGAVGRYGGEEFVIVLRDISAQSAEELAERLVDSIRTFDVASLGLSAPVTCSLGAVWADRLPFNSAEELFAAADERMYEAKRNGKDGCRFARLSSTGQGAPAGGPDTPDTKGTSAPDAAQHTTDDQTEIEELLALARQLNGNLGDEFVGIRKQERRRLVLPCIMHYFAAGSSDLHTEPAATRNMSTGGVGLLTNRPMIRGEAVEIVMDKNSSTLYLAGLVSFCRNIDGKIHEIGVQFVAHAATPIISGDSAGALKTHDWIARAVDAKHAGTLETQSAS